LSASRFSKEKPLIRPFCLANIGDLACRQDEADRVAESVDVRGVRDIVSMTAHLLQS
jgi:hypothetical protein